MKLTKKELHTLIRCLAYYKYYHAKSSEDRFLQILTLKLVKEASKIEREVHK